MAALSPFTDYGGYENQASMSVYARAHIYIHIHVCRFACKCTCILVQLYWNIHFYTDAHKCACMCVYVYICACLFSSFVHVYSERTWEVYICAITQYLQHAWASCLWTVKKDPKAWDESENLRTKCENDTLLGPNGGGAAGK